MSDILSGSAEQTEMQIADYIRSRIGRGVSRIGPNEGRVLFDGVSATVSSLLALVFCDAVLPGGVSARDILIAAALPPVLVGLNLVVGIYSRFRIARARIKALLLSAVVAVSAGGGWIFVDNRAVVVLWAMLVIGPIILARLLLSLHTGRHRTLARIAVNRRGPVLVIGGAGYIGSQTVDALLKHGHEVRVLDRLMFGDRALADFRDHPTVTLITGDATDISKLTAAMKDCSTVVHLAGLVGDPACAVNPEFTRHTNIIATRMARQVAESLGVHRFIFASSCSVYGVSDKKVSEADTLNPVSLYAQTKIDSERELLATVNDDFFVTILRFATVFGHSRRPRFDLVANLFTAQAITDGLITVVGPTQWRPFIHVRDLARAIVMTIEADPFVVQSQIFNVGDDCLDATILGLAEQVRAIASRYRPVQISVTENPQDRRNYAICTDKIRTILKFRAETTIAAGIQEMVDHLLAGDYGHYRAAEYSNVAITTEAVNAFHDPAQMAHLYAPLRVT
jgi:nucleoside-diphosphate-sugar epimerase